MEASRPRRRVVRFLLGLLASTVIFLGAGELLSRQLDIVDRMNATPRRLYLASNSPDLPYRLRPGVALRVRDTFDVRVNRFGLRGPEIPPAPAPPRRRILVLGDSVVFGEGLEESDTFPVLLAQALEAEAGRPVEVLNGGVSGYNTETELAFLRDIGLALGPQALVLGVSQNDYGPAPHMAPAGFLTNEPTRTRLPWLTNHSEFYTLLRWLVTWARGEHLYQRISARAGPPSPGPREDRWPQIDQAIAKMHKRFYVAPRGPGWQSVRRSLAGLRDLARAHGLPLTVVIFPEKDQVELPEPSLDPQRQWLALCAELGVTCLDLLPAFVAEAGSGPLFLDTQHPNAAGLRIAARVVAGALAP